MERVAAIIGGTVWTEDGPVAGDLYIDEQGKISAVVPRSGKSRGACEASPEPAAGGAPVPGAAATGRVIDAAGLWVLPGGVDVHVHFREPGITESEDFLSGSAAAACGGVTTVLDMPNTVPPVSDGGALSAKLTAVAGRSYVDYGIFGAAVAGQGKALIRNVEEMAALGACGIKVFLGPTTGDIAAPTWGELYELTALLAGTGLVFAFHCEDRDVIASMSKAKETLDPRDYQSALALRPRFGELLATDGVLRLALETGAQVHIAHVTLKEAVAAIAHAKGQGAQVTAETCPQYLFLHDGDFARAGLAMKALPPIRTAADREALWAGLRQGALDAVATDHAPHRTQEPRSERVWDPPFGIAGVQTMMPLLLDAALRGVCKVEEVVRWTSANPARAYGLYPAKGRLGPGADADVALFDPQARWSVETGWWKGKSMNTPFRGYEGLGAPVLTVLRGRIVAERGELVGKPSGSMVSGRREKGWRQEGSAAKMRKCR